MVLSMKGPWGRLLPELSMGFACKGACSFVAWATNGLGHPRPLLYLSCIAMSSNVPLGHWCGPLETNLGARLSRPNSQAGLQNPDQMLLGLFELSI